jgi:hypothetical protein
VKHKALIGAILGVLFTPFAIAISLKFARDGDFYWAGVFFPILTLMLFKGAGPLILPLALLQYPFFGWYSGRCLSREHYIRLAVLLSLLQIFPMLLGMMN